MWTLAVTTLAGISVNDEMPLSYSHHAQTPTLTDHHLPKVSAAQVSAARTYADRSVREIRELLFERHGLNVG